MLRRALGFLIALVTPIVWNVALGSLLGYLPSPMFWSRTNVLFLLASLLVGAAVSAFAARRVTKLGQPTAAAALFSLVVSVSWWVTGDPILTVLAIALCGIVGAWLGNLLAAGPVRTRSFDPSAA
jgi:hypothetical protein